MSSKSSVLDCIADLYHEDKAVRNLAAIKIAGFGEEALPLVTPLLDDASWVIRYRACEILGRISSDESYASLCTMLDDKKDHVRYMAVKGLGLSGRSEAVSLITPMLKDENNFVRRISVIMLGELSVDEGLAALREHAKVESDPVVLASLERAIRFCEI